MNQGRTVRRLDVATAMGMITVFLEDPTFDREGDKIIATQRFAFHKQANASTPKTPPPPPA